MKFTVNYLSFFVIQVEGKEGQTVKNYKHFQTMDGYEYVDSEIRSFLDGEFSRIAKRKVEKNPAVEQAPTKIGRFIVEPGYELDSNPNFNMFARLRGAEDKEDYKNACDDLVRSYLDTSSVRGGALIVIQAKLEKYSEDPYIFVLKCDFEPKIARISDERSLISTVEMAISARNMKSILYPHMYEEGMVDEWELKIHQSSHAKYFEDFLRFVTYEMSIPEIVNEQVMEFVQTYVENKWPDENEEERQQVEKEIELWAASEKRVIQDKWEPAEVIEAAERIVEIKPEIELKFRIGDTVVKGKLADFGNEVHIAKLNGRYAVILEGESISFDKAFSPVELLQPDSFEVVAQRIMDKKVEVEDDDLPPF
ncbi:MULTISPECIES: DUF3900 domain-containing protein [unclassified Paenibacillus]|uniref:DUF3900 domain-containing protein n=1 Tax=unclassified Paenibacillus TaxID=185978 RepID=UPI0008396C14|nr:MULTISPECIES: DUF3900 domain-containing protein [unclassified Paenibacillus]NWL90127.1 DUF3900 domain-containing protein [Paenibacillus sp. 79R4]